MKSVRLKAPFVDRAALALQPGPVVAFAPLTPTALPGSRISTALSLAALLEESFRRWPGRPAFRFMGRRFTFAQVDAWSRAFAAWLQASGLVRGDRVALMLPNVPQYPVAAAAALRAGLVVVNINPESNASELAHRLKDSGARAIVVIDHACAVVQQVLGPASRLKVVIARLGDLLGPLKGPLVNHAARRGRKGLPLFQEPGDLPFAEAFVEALAAGRKLRFTPPAVRPDDIALLQYTGGTTAVCKAAVLLHRHLAANLLQCEAWFQPALRTLAADEQPLTACALPLHHILGFNITLMLPLHLGACGILMAQADDVPGMLKELGRHRIHILPGDDALFQSLASHPDLDRVDWSALRLSVAGGARVRQTTAELWLRKTGCALCESYGLTEASWAVSCNPVEGRVWNGSVGLPLPGTEIRLLDDAGQPVAPGATGEIAIRGPQVMAGYWQRPEETARVMTADFFFRSGDLGVIEPDGQLRLIDRKKDTILVDGHPVYPSQVESAVALLPGVLECAAVGVPDKGRGEAVKLVVVRCDPACGSPSEAEVRAHCTSHLAACQRPRDVDFRAALPRSTVGKVMRRALREHG